MAKSTMIKIKLLSSADTGYFYVTKKNSRTQTEKMVKKKYDPVAKKHVESRETKIKKKVPAIRMTSALAGRNPGQAYRLFKPELFVVRLGEPKCRRNLTHRHARRFRSGYEPLIIRALRWWPVGSGVFEEATPTAPTGRTPRTQEMRRT